MPLENDCYVYVVGDDLAIAIEMSHSWQHSDLESIYVLECTLILFNKRKCLQAGKNNPKYYLTCKFYIKTQKTTSTIAFKMKVAGCVSASQTIRRSRRIMKQEEGSAGWRE